MIKISVPMRANEIACELLNCTGRIKCLPVCIPSYSRPEGAAIRALENHKEIKSILFIRKEQEELYRDVSLKKVKLNHVHDIGSTRRAIINYLRINGIKECFMIDDDVSIVDYLYPHKGSNSEFMRPSLLNNGLKSGWNPIAFSVWHRLIKEIPFSIAMCGIPLRQFCFSIPKTVYKIDCSIPMQCFYINIKELDRLGISFEPNSIIGWEDAALAYKIVRAGGHTAQITLLTYACPEMGSNKGGIQSQYDGSNIARSQEYSNAFMENVAKGDPAVYKKELKNGQTNIRINWRAIKVDEK